jgi:hypothetical protein
MKHITDEVLQLLTQAGKIAKPDKALAAEYYAGNLAAIKAKPPGEFARIKGMPQADDSGVAQADVNKALAQGRINFDSPELSDIREARKTTPRRLKRIIQEELIKAQKQMREENNF